MRYVVGVDIVKISRLKEEHAVKILSKQELNLYKNSQKKREFLAGRWAVKEAIIKAYKIIPMTSINIIYINKKPAWEGFEGKASISISHESDNAIAICIYDKETEN